MKALVVAVAFVLAGPALAQVQVNVQLPTITFPAPPPLVVIQPGVQVVENHDEEIFFVDGWYWHRRGPHWYRTNAHNGAWVVVEPNYVPAPIVRFQPGHYRRWRGRGHGPGKVHKATVVVNPPGPGKVKVKVKGKGKHH